MSEPVIQIDEELRKSLFPLRPEEFEQLEQSIIGEGCRDPLVLWGDTLIDGHNRLTICQKHGIEYQTVQREFGSRDDAIAWMEDNQLGRRNLSPNHFRLLLGRKNNRLKRKRGAPEGNDNAGKQTRQNDGFVSTAEKLAAEHGTSARTVERPAVVAKAEPPGRIKKGRNLKKAAAFAPDSLDCGDDPKDLSRPGPLLNPSAHLDGYRPVHVRSIGRLALFFKSIPPKIPEKALARST